MKVGVTVGLKVGNLLLAMEIDYGMSSFIAKNKLPTLRPNSYLHTQNECAHLYNVNN